MALQRVMGWFTSNDGKKEEHSGEKELCPLTEGEVATYGSHGDCSGTEEEEYDIVSSSEADYNYELVSGDRLEGQAQLPPSAHGGVLKTAPGSKALCPAGRRQAIIEWRSRSDMPVRMKGLQATVHRGRVYIGGGYTGHAKTEMTVYEYDPTFDLWAELPITPMRWFGLVEYQSQLVLVGGKDVEAGRGFKSTNRIAVYDDTESRWVHPYPPMLAARSHPVVISHTHWLVVAGGRRGVLDYHVEVFNGDHWAHTAPLPVPCSPLSSHVHNGRWYLLGGVVYSTIYHRALEDYLAPLTIAEETAEPNVVHTSDWETLAPPPFLASRVMSVDHHVTVFHSSSGGEGSSVQVHLLLGDSWVYAGRVPHVCSSASVLCLPGGDLLLLGGDVDGFHYSNKMYRVTAGSTGEQRKKAKFASVPVT